MDKEEKKRLVAAYRERRTEGGVYSLTNTATGARHVFSDADLAAARHKFDFMQKTGSESVYGAMRREVERYGCAAFAFEVLETLERGKDQTQAEYVEDLGVLEEDWRSRA